MPTVPRLPGPRMAQVIATSVYADPKLRQLRATAADAKAMADVLGNPAIGGFTVERLLNRPEHEIRRGIDQFLGERRVDDVVVLYLSCHGLLDARGKLFFAALDTVKDRPNSTAIEAAWLLERLETCRARQQVLILDCCFSGAINRPTKGAGDDVDLERRLAPGGRGRAVLTASRATEFAYTEEHQPGSVFTAVIVEALRDGAADTDFDGYVSVEELFAYVSARLRGAGSNQTPQMQLYGGEGQIVLARNPHGAGPRSALLPPDLRDLLNSSEPEDRSRAVAALAAWFGSGDQAKVTIATQVLTEVADTDVAAVAAAARAALRDTPVVPAPVPVRPRKAIDAAHDGLALNAVTFGPHGRFFATGGEDASVRIWDPRFGRQLGLMTGDDVICAVALSPDGQSLASAGADRTVRLWSVAKRLESRAALAGHTDTVSAVVFAGDSRAVASASWDGTVRLWNLNRMNPYGTVLEGHHGQVHAVAWSPLDRVASGGADRSVLVWNPFTHERDGPPLRGHDAAVTSVAFSPDGRLLASASADHTVRLWKPPSVRRLTGHTGVVTSVAFSPDGRQLVSASRDTTVRLWDVDTGAQIGAPLQGHTAAVRSAVFSPDGTMVVSAGEDGTVCIWDR